MHNRQILLLFLRQRHVSTIVRLQQEGEGGGEVNVNRGTLSLVPSGILSRWLELKFYGGYDRNHWRVNRVKLVLYDVTIATFYKASWGS